MVIYKPVPVTVFDGVHPAQRSMFASNARKIHVYTQDTRLHWAMQEIEGIVRRCPRLTELSISLDGLEKTYAKELQRKISDRIIALNNRREPPANLTFVGKPDTRAVVCVGLSIHGVWSREQGIWRDSE